jgi:hypothetical protein
MSRASLRVSYPPNATDIMTHGDLGVSFGGYDLVPCSAPCSIHCSNLGPNSGISEEQKIVGMAVVDHTCSNSFVAAEVGRTEEARRKHHHTELAAAAQQHMSEPAVVVDA